MSRLLIVLFLVLINLGVDDPKKSNSITLQTTPSGALMAVFAHPDDELLVGGTLAYYARKGIKVYVVVATDGALGKENFYTLPQTKTLPQVRMAEMRCSAKALGIEPPIFLGLPDQLSAQQNGLPTQIDRLRHKVDSLFKFYKPKAVITFGANGWTGHPDHRLIGNVVTDVFESKEWPWKPRLYYPALPTGSITDTSWATYLTVDAAYLTVQVNLDSIDYQRLRNAYQCHQSQYRDLVRTKLPLFMEEVQKGQALFRPFISSDTLTHSLL